MLAQSAEGRIASAHLLEEGEGLPVVALLVGDVGADEGDHVGILEPLERGADGGCGLVGQAELELDVGEVLGEVGTLWDGVMHGFEQGKGLFVASAVHQRAGQLPVVLALGLLGRGGRVVGDGVDIAEGDEVLEHGVALAVAELEIDHRRVIRCGLFVGRDIRRKALRG